VYDLVYDGQRVFNIYLGNSAEETIENLLMLRGHGLAGSLLTLLTPLIPTRRVKATRWGIFLHM